MNYSTSIPKDSVELEDGDLKAPESPTINPKERLSAYFTILASAFGLISDGCEFLVAFLSINNLITSSFVPDQNNLMTMSNVSISCGCIR